jgi:hypothetical protein
MTPDERSIERGGRPPTAARAAMGILGPAGPAEASTSLPRSTTSDGRDGLPCDRQTGSWSPAATAAGPVSSGRDGAPGVGDPERLGKYRVVGRLGHGGQGTALKAFDPDLGRHVVLKMYHSDALGDRATRALDEGQALARVQHPHVARCLAAERMGDAILLILEYIPGCNLEDLRRDRTPTFSESARLVERVADGLGEVHACHVLHRDVKPANIVLGDDGSPRLVDFGLATGGDHRPPESLSGTVEYMAPEQARPEPERIGPRTDVFGLGAVLYFLLTGRPPYEAHRFVEALELARHGRFPAPREINPKVPKALERICLKAMAPAPERRYASAAEMQRALRGYRRRVPLALIAAATAAALIGLGALLFSRGPATGPPLDGSLAVEQFRLADGSRRFLALGRIGDDAMAAQPNDDVRVRVNLEAPAYFYLLALNPDGRVELCFPPDPATPPVRITTVVFPPGEEDYYGLTDGVGTQGFVLVASRSPLPRFADWAPAAGLPWSRADGEGVWVFDGRSLTLRSAIARRPPDRGIVRRRDIAPKPFLAACRQLREAPGVELVRGIAFPIMERR